jgi:flagellar biosynthetic protein FlhB
MTEAAERVHPASPQRRQQARREGHVARSRDLASSAALLAGLLALQYGSRGLIDFFGVFARDQFSGQPWSFANPQTVVLQWRQLIEGLAQSLLPLLALIFLASVLGHVGQTGFLFLPQRLAPDWSRVSPARTLEKLFSWTHLAELGFGLLKAAAIVAVVAYSLGGGWSQWIAVGSLDPFATARVMLEISLETGVRVASVLLLLGIMDYLWQRYRVERELRMSNEELREELRQQQSDSQAAGRRSQIQRASSRRRAA